VRPTAVATLLVGLCAASGVAAAEPVRADAFKPRAASVYAGDPEADLKLRIEEIFGVFLVDPPRRHASERVELTARQVVLNYWQPSQGQTDAELLTRATQFCLLGRTQFSPGARAVFSEMPDIDEVVLIFHDVIRKDQKGRRLAAESVTPYLKARLTRGRFQRLKLEPVRACVDKGDCSAVFRAAFDEARFDRKGIKSR
jgi:hypothetical protein